MRAISAYEIRSSAYRLAKVFLSRFGTVSDSIYRQGLTAPFMVELFTAGFFGPSPSVVIRPVECVAAFELPTSASVERGFRDLHPFRSEERVCPRTPRRDLTDCFRRTHFDCHGPPFGGSFPVAPLQRGTKSHGIELKDYSKTGITLQSLPRTGQATLMASGSTGLPRCG